MGDFNEIISEGEKEGGRARFRSLILNFQHTLEDCRLIDLGFVGNKYTWCNNHMDESWTRLRLDRGIATDSWRNLFSEAKIFNLLTVASDHIPIIISLPWLLCHVLAHFKSGPRNVEDPNSPEKRIFRFENLWAKESGCKEIISKFWARKDRNGSMGGSPVSSVPDYLQSTGPIKISRVFQIRLGRRKMC